MGRYSDCTYFDALYDAVSGLFPVISRPNACTILRETILAPSDYEVEFNNISYDKTRIQQMIARELIDSCVENTPEQTFYDILENAAQTMKHMNDGYISTDDYHERQTFLEHINRHEFILFAALAFLRTSESDDTKVLGGLILNIIRLREINDLILNYTRDAVEIEVSRAEYEQAKPIYRMLKSLQNLGYEYNFSPKERYGLGIDHEDDSDLTEDFGYENWLKRLMLLQLRKEIDMDNKNVSAEASKPAENEKKSEAPVSKADLIEKLRGIRNARHFDIERFRRLEENAARPTPADNET